MSDPTPKSTEDLTVTMRLAAARAAVRLRKSLEAIAELNSLLPEVASDTRAEFKGIREKGGKAVVSIDDGGRIEIRDESEPRNAIEGR